MPNETDIHPFRVDVPQADLDDLRARLLHTRWPDRQPVDSWDYGVPLAYLQELVAYWSTSYDWRTYEAQLNAFPQFTTSIDGTNVHFLHVRSPEPDALPLIITHGWPGSVAEFTEVIGPLTDPRKYGADPADAFHVVAPSLPGFGFSGPTHDTGWNTDRVATAWAELMQRLGYGRYGAQGGDTGSIISPQLGRIDPDHVIGIHVNGLGTFPSGDPTELEGLSDADQGRLAHLQQLGQQGIGYAVLQSTRPQTLAYALTDSPAGQLAWIVEKFKEWTNPAANLPEDAIARDRILTDVAIYWLTGTAGSSARIYFEGARSWGQKAARSSVPTGVAVFPGDVTLEKLARRDHNVVRWTEFDRGGHFAAMETPDLLVEDMREFFRPLR
jgi:epoxide hydrolase